MRAMDTLNTWLNPLLPPHPVLLPIVATLLIFGLRYLVMAGLAYGVAHPARERGIGRPHAQVPRAFDNRAHLRREIGYSLLSVGVFALINAALYGYGWVHASQLYYRWDDYPLWWVPVSIFLMLVLHDSLFYWVHRLMHTPFWYRRLHDVHHRSVYPTAFATYSFQPSEALVEGLIVTAVIFLVPTHLMAFLVFQFISTAYNVYGHCGRELYPRGQPDHWLGRWLNTSTLHAGHHYWRRGNYGLYFTFWDRAMGTLRPPEPART